MFLGHFGLAFGAKRWAPRLSLGALFLAAQFADLLWPVLLLAGVEKVVIAPGVTAVTPLDFVSYPYSHSLLALALWAALFAVVYLATVRREAVAAVTLAALVLSHWLLDAVSHRPDMPLLPGSASRVGLGLWNSVPATLAVELTLLGIGLLLYLRATRAVDRVGRFALAGLVAFLLVVYAASVLGPPPPNVEAVAWTTQAMWLLVLWGFWIDRHRTTSGALRGTAGGTAGGAARRSS